MDLKQGLKSRQIKKALCGDTGAYPEATPPLIFCGLTCVCDFESTDRRHVPKRSNARDHFHKECKGRDDPLGTVPKPDDFERLSLQLAVMTPD
jgi:hypothetical protein